MIRTLLITSCPRRSIRMSSPSSLPLLLIFLSFSSWKSVRADLTRHVTILGALSTAEHVKILNEQTNRSYSSSNNVNLYLSSQSFLLDTNPLLIAIKLCELGFASHAKSIIAGRGLDGNDLTLTAISYVSDFYHIPILTVASRENLFSDKVKRRRRENAFFDSFAGLVQLYRSISSAVFVRGGRLVQHHLALEIHQSRPDLQSGGGRTDGRLSIPDSN